MSLISALGRITAVDDRTLTILLTSGIHVKRHCTDVIVFNVNAKQEADIDLLNLPLYGQADNDNLILDESQFTHLETGGYLISGTKDREAIFHGNPILDATEDIGNNGDEREQDLEVDIPGPDSIHLQQSVRRSSRIQTPSLRFLETIASAED